MEVDGGLEVFAVAVAAGGDADGLDAGVEAFGAGVRSHRQLHSVAMIGVLLVFG